VNAVGYVAFALWLPAAAYAFAVLRPPLAAAVTLLAAAMFLPCGSIDLPGVPVLGKDAITGLGGLLGGLLFAAGRLRAARPGRGPEILVIVALAGGVFTFLNNRAPLFFGPVTVPGTAITDLFVPDVWLVWGVPFLLGRAFFRQPSDLRLLLACLAVAALVYSPLILLELRLSPQLHRWVYGYHQHAFVQTLRGSGYRPMAFMAHGLVLTLFVALALMAATTLTRVRQRVLGFPAALAAAWLAGLLVLCKSTGAILYAACAVPAIALLSARAQVLAATAVAGVVLSYPVLRTLDLVPVEAMVEAAADAVGRERADSLQARLVNEKEVLERAREQIWFGWSGYGRPMLRDPETGENRTTFDGYWVLSLGEGGVVRFVAIFGLILYPVWMAARRIDRIPAPADRMLVAGVCSIVAVRAFNLLPNTAVDPWLTLFSGALAGAVGAIPRRRPRRRPPPQPVASP
jgi:hypothetical protein